MLDRRQIHTVVDTLIREARIRSVSDIHITDGDACVVPDPRVPDTGQGRIEGV